MIALPQYVDREAWDGFEEMRKTIKKPMTDRARKMIVTELQKLKDAGHDPNAALDQSTNNCWADVYVPKQKVIERAAQAAADETVTYLRAEASRSVVPMPDHLRRRQA